MTRFARRTDPRENNIMVSFLYSSGPDSGTQFRTPFLVALSGKFHFLETHKRTIEWVSASTGKWRTTCLFNEKRLLNRWISSYGVPVALTKRGSRKEYLLGTKKLRTPF